MMMFSLVSLQENEEITKDSSGDKDDAAVDLRPDWSCCSLFIEVCFYFYCCESLFLHFNVLISRTS